MYGHVITKDDFHNRNPRFIAFLKANKLKPGDKWKTYEFMSWCLSMTEKYRTKKGLIEGERHNQNDLSNWMIGKVENSTKCEQLKLF